MRPSPSPVGHAQARALERGSARIRHAPGAVEPVPAPEELLGRGEASFALRRTRIVVEGAALARALGEAARPEVAEELRGRATVIWHAGGMRGEQAEGVWRWQGRSREAGQRRLDDPTWPIEALAQAQAWRELGEDAVGERPCRLFAAVVEGPSRPGRRARAEVAVHVWIDGDGLPVRMSWRGPRTGELWRVTELDDYGVDVGHLERVLPLPSRRAVARDLARRWLALSS